MTLEITLMSVGLACMILLLVHKHLETTRGMKSRVSGVREKADPILESAHDATHKFFSYLTLRNVVIVANYMFVGIVRLFMNMSRRIHDTSSRVVEKASKKKEDLSRSGAASFYLKKIKEGQEERHTTGNI